jgi:uncharacterized phage protein gp47/JayE
LTDKFERRTFESEERRMRTIFTTLYKESISSCSKRRTLKENRSIRIRSTERRLLEMNK